MALNAKRKSGEGVADSPKKKAKNVSEDKPKFSKKTAPPAKGPKSKPKQSPAGKVDGPKDKNAATKPFAGKKPFDGKKPFTKNNKFNGKGKAPDNKNMKPADWNEFKKQKKELRMKRRSKNPIFDSIKIPKQLGEKIRCKNLAAEERNKLIEKVHEQCKGKDLYPKFVLTHDMARIVQILLKYGVPQIREEIIKELIPVTMQMMDSKYGKFVIKRMLKYSNNELRSSTIKAMYGNAVKLTSHALSAPIFEYAYSTWATPQEKMHLVQEFFGEMYKNSKDDKLKHLRDVYAQSPDMKAAALSAVKLNLSRIMNKDLLDSALVQTVLHQYLTECTEENRNELISQLAAHVVILSNSKDGVRVVMKCIWNGSNKDRKIAMKALKEHVLELAKHEHGHCGIIALLDAADDTVLLNKLIITEIIKHADKLLADVIGRKVLQWLVSPGDSTHFHPHFIKELQAGKDASTCKKATDIRRKEILDYAEKGLLKAIANKPEEWLNSGATAIVTLAVLKKGSGEELKEAYQSMAKVICDEEWKVKENDAEVSGIEHAGLHMVLKKLAQHDKVLKESGETTFGENLLEHVDAVISSWLTLNRGCFFLVTIFENGTESTQKQLKEKLNKHIKIIKKQTTPGCKILLKKIG